MNKFKQNTRFKGVLMFICSVRASTIKFFGVIALTLAVLFSVLAFGEQSTVYASAGGVEIDYGGMKTNEDRVKFIEGFGLKVKEEPTTEESFAMPENFDRVINGYNEIQKMQGLDLSKYKKKRVTHYSYEVENYNHDGKVTVNLLVYKNRVIACDLSSLEENGFVLPLISVDKANLK